MVMDDAILTQEEQSEETFLPSRTYHVHNGRIQGNIDGLGAIRQAVDKLLRTERFAYVIYSHNYGTEIERFKGENFDFVKADLERTIADALSADDRIEGISDFEMEQTERATLTCHFIVNTIEGAFLNEMEVTV